MNDSMLLFTRSKRTWYSVTQGLLRNDTKDGGDELPLIHNMLTFWKFAKSKINAAVMYTSTVICGTRLCERLTCALSRFKV